MTNKEKRLSRCTSLQILYGLEISDNSKSDLLCLIKSGYIDEGNLEFWENKYPPEIMESDFTRMVEKYSYNLVHQTLKNCSYLDSLICEKSKNWDISRIALIDNIILRMAIGEMLFLDEIPLKVSIAEAIEIAKCFSTKDSGRFVNGILDAIYHDIKNGKIMVH